MVVGDGPYVGSETCLACHDDHASWRGSHHALAERPVGPGEAAALEKLDGALPGPDGWSVDLDGVGPRPVVGVLGVAPLWQLLVEIEPGRVQATQLAWDVGEGEWFDVFAGEERRVGEWGHWTGRGMNWNSMCATCHNTAFTKGYALVDDRYGSERAEQGVGCEACHGPGGDHARSPSEPLADLSDPFDTCAVCHARRAPLGTEWQAGEALLDHYRPDLPSTTSWFADGQVRDEDFEAVAFFGSKMHGEHVSCVDCHDPHSGETVRDGDALCLGCHGDTAPLTPHSHHAPDAVSCVDCHMPLTTYMGRHPRRDHGLLLPDPALGLELGLPDACTRCHDDLSQEEAASAAEAWFGEIDPARRRWARAMATGRPELLAAELEGERSLRRAAVASVTRDPARVRQLLVDPDPWVRMGATAALVPDPRLPGEQAALTAALGDPVRAVRLGVASAIGPGWPPAEPVWAELTGTLEEAADQPQGALALAAWRQTARGGVTTLELLQRAVAWDPAFAPALVSLASELSRLQRSAEAERVLEGALTRGVDDGSVWRALALARGARGAHAEALAAMERAALLLPDGRTLYNLAVLRQTAGDLPGAIEAAMGAEQAGAGADATYALGLYLLEAGRPDEARLVGQRLARTAPGHAGVARLIGPR